MAGTAKYWMSSQRGLPRPSGRLGGEIESTRAGAISLPWSEQGGAGALPRPLYLQSRAETRAEFQAAGRAQRYVQEARARAGLAHGPGAASAPAYDEVMSYPAPSSKAASYGPAGASWAPKATNSSYSASFAHDPPATEPAGPVGPGEPPRRTPFDAPLSDPGQPIAPGEGRRLQAGARGAAGPRPRRPSYPPGQFDRAQGGRDVDPGPREFWERQTSGYPSPYGFPPPVAGLADAAARQPLGLQPAGSGAYGFPTGGLGSWTQRPERREWEGPEGTVGAAQARRAWREQMAQRYREL